jgi:hypothetical protein
MIKLKPGEGCQYALGGFTALGDASNAQIGEYAPSVRPDSVVQQSQPDATDRAFEAIERKVAKHNAVVAKLAPAAIKPRDVLRLARARVREIRAELKRHAALKKELTQLENMLSAAKPLASVRALDSVRRRAV